MQVIGFLSGILVFYLIFFAIKRIDRYNTGKIYELSNNYRMGDLGYLYNKWAEFFKNESFRRSIPYGLRFKYYGGIWQLGTASELYFVSSSFQGIGKETPEYKSSWNYWRYDFKSMKYIMENHPNLRNARKTLKKEDRKPIIIND